MDAGGSGGGMCSESTLPLARGTCTCACALASNLGQSNRQCWCRCWCRCRCRCRYHAGYHRDRTEKKRSIFWASQLLHPPLQQWTFEKYWRPTNHCKLSPIHNPMGLQIPYDTRFLEEDAGCGRDSTGKKKLFLGPLTWGWRLYVHPNSRFLRNIDINPW